MKASESKCIVCGKQAVAFWPVIDPDIPSWPYCRKCLDEAKIEMIIKSFDYSERAVKAMAKQQNRKKK